LRNVDALIHVVRCFDDPDLPHINDVVDPAGDAEEVETELAIADLEVAENALRNAERKARTGDKEAKLRAALMQRCVDALSAGTPVSRVTFSEEEHRAIRSFAMLTARPVLYVANIGEGDIGADNAYVTALRAYAAQRGSEVVAVCAKLEAELAELEEAERGEMLQGLGLAEPALNVLARAAYHVLGLQSFFTAGDKENRAWTIPIGAKAPEAAGAIHSDLQRGFIRVEVFSVDDLAQHKSEAAIKAAGKLRVEGKDYAMRDGDVCHFLFNV
jgi:GTP-binding protein YchF